jgi:hypothetical protein
MTTAIGNEPFSIAVVITRGFTGLQRSAVRMAAGGDLSAETSWLLLFHPGIPDKWGVLAAKFLGESQENTGKTTISTINGGF